MLSKWHVHAKDYLKQALHIPDIEVTLVWDENKDRGEAWAREIGVPFEPDLNKALTEHPVDAVVIDTPTNMHKEVILTAAKHKKHIFTEKVLSFDINDCEEIFKAVEENHVQLMVSLPRLTENYYLYAQQALDEGLLGRLTSVRCRFAHNGAVPTNENPNGWLPSHFFDAERCGGGAFIDLGAHPIYLSNRLAGPAKAVTARLTTNLNSYQVDDNAVAIVEFQSGALGMLETSFVSSGSPFQLELYGTEGTVMIEDNQMKIQSNKLKEKGWITPTNIPEPLPMPMEQWIDAIKNQTYPTITNEDVFQLTQINQAAALSHQQNRRVTISSLNES